MRLTEDQISLLTTAMRSAESRYREYAKELAPQNMTNLSVIFEGQANQVANLAALIEMADGVEITTNDRMCEMCFQPSMEIRGEEAICSHCEAMIEKGWKNAQAIMAAHDAEVAR